MTDLSDFKRMVYEPEVKALVERISDLYVRVEHSKAQAQRYADRLLDAEDELRTLKQEMSRREHEAHARGFRAAQALSPGLEAPSNRSVGESSEGNDGVTGDKTLNGFRLDDAVLTANGRRGDIDEIVVPVVSFQTSWGVYKGTVVRVSDEYWIDSALTPLMPPRELLDAYPHEMQDGEAAPK